MKARSGKGRSRLTMSAPVDDFGWPPNARVQIMPATQLQAIARMYALCKRSLRRSP